MRLNITDKRINTMVESQNRSSRKSGKGAQENSGAKTNISKWCRHLLPALLLPPPALYKALPSVYFSG
jgi:hypothetical protein